ncbi:hypothetical protein HPNQ4200_1644 [Helicobacter pylori NQ4200]|uniref:Uncharacterized protein n=1 Tax=Helicobacter pylori NQ4200 TaxID=992024 RepID=I9Q2C2_HELPX|nr:hypothetical protein HPNQ4200_1644 [Helicobacter pylori NQ4200]
MIAKTLRNIFIYSKNDSFKVIGGYFGDEYPFNSQPTPFKNAF